MEATAEKIHATNNVTDNLHDNAGATLLQQAIAATRQTAPDETAALLRALTTQAMQGVVCWDKNLPVTITNAIAALDRIISAQLAQVMHCSRLQQLEGSWRGLRHLVWGSETGTMLKIRMLNVGKAEISRDLAKAVEFDQSQLFRRIYEHEFGTAGGEPYGALIGDFEFGNDATDIDMLKNLSHIAAAGFAPFIAAAAPSMFGLQSHTELAAPRDLAKIFDAAEYTRWRGFRETEDARFVTLVLPRVLARLPYGQATQPIEGFRFEEFPLDNLGRNTATDHADYCWMNAAYVMGSVLTRAFAEYGWCTHIRGAENGGRVDGLPLHSFVSEDGDISNKCPTEIGLADRREAELSRLGFLPLCHYKNTDYAVFFGAQTSQKPKKFDTPDASANAAISAQLPYLMATSRIAHYLKVMARDKVGSFLEAQDAENWLNHWIGSYCNSNPGASAETRARFPLAEARVEVREVAGMPGTYNAVAWLRPWLQMEELSASLRLVASIPKSS